MATVHLHADAAPDDVFAVASNPWRYPDWVVGAKKVRGVDDDWPRPGSRFHHRFGLGPATVDDSTVLEAFEPPRRMVLRVRARPTGMGRVELKLNDDGTGGTDIEMTEYPLAGVPKRLDGKVLDAVVAVRNLVSLRRLRRLASGH
jgi:uncharacterized protein YndB with AHSA1/START domain